MGQEWSEATANISVNNSSSSLTYNSSSSSLTNQSGGNASSSGGYNNTSTFYDEPSSGSSYQGGFSAEKIKSQTGDFFARKQAENASRPEYV